MKPRLIVNNSEALPSQIHVSREPPEARLAAAWRAMQDVMRDHSEGEIGKEEALDILSGYLNDPKFDADARALEV
jgi:hypothetical protein